MRAAITGAASGIGFAAATRCARDGWDIVAIDIEPAPFDDGRHHRCAVGHDARGRPHRHVPHDAGGPPGIINEIMQLAPAATRVVGGVCMERATITPFFGISKELNIQFVLGYDPMEFAGSLRSIAEGEIDVQPMITGEVPLEVVDEGVHLLVRLSPIEVAPFAGGRAYLPPSTTNVGVGAGMETGDRCE